MSEGQEVSVTIYGSQFSLRTTDDPQLLKDLAQHVDREMHRVAEDSGVMQTLRVAILTSLHLADELARVRRERDEQTDQVTTALDRLEPLLDKAVGADV